MTIVAGFVVPGQPHPLLCPEANPGYQRLADAYADVRRRIEAIDPDLILLYSTQWISIIGHQVQADPEPTWTHVDPEWHELGSIPYKFRIDPGFADHYVARGRDRGLEMRSVAYHGFPMDTGTVVALQLLNPDNAIPASVISCNMYADRQETLVLGKAAADAARQAGKRVVAIAVTGLSTRMHAEVVPFEDDHIHSLKDDEWNRKYLEFLAEGRLEDASQLAREFSRQAGGDQKMKAIWWLAAAMGQNNNYEGDLLAYEPVYGTGAAVVALTPTTKAAAEAEFDEDDAEVYQGDRNVLGGINRFEAGTTTRQVMRESDSGIVQATAAPEPVGAYPHARRVGDMLYLSGLGPRDPTDNSVPGGPVWDDAGTRQEYDIHAQTEAVIANMKTVLAASGATIDDVVDCTCYLIDMARDFVGFNEVYAKHFGDVQATRTTLEINRLPTPIAVEFKVIARLP